MNDLSTFLSRYPLRKWVYAVILSVVALCIVVAFFYIALSLRHQIDRIFVPGSPADAFSIDLANYKLVAGKLNLPDTGSAKPAQNNPASPAATTESTEGTTTPTIVLDKKALSIGVYNATNVTGLAGKLKARLENEGFSVAETGNKTAVAESSVSLKESRKSYFDLIRGALGTGFEALQMQTLPEDSPLDCIIIIGANTVP